MLACSVPAHAVDGWNPVHVRVAGKEFVNRIPSISDGAETYVPMEVLALFGADWHINDRGDALVVTLRATGRQSELALAKPNGTPMVALSDVAKLLNAAVLQPDALGKDGKPIVGQKGDTVYLLARVTGATWDGNGLHVTTSFPVPFHVRSIADVRPVRSYIDLVGALVADEFKPSALPQEDPRPLKIRTGQNSADVARIVVELAEGSELKASDSTSNSETRIVAGVERIPTYSVIAKADPSVKSPIRPPVVNRTPGVVTPTPGSPIRTQNPDPSRTIASADSGNPNAPGSVTKGGPGKSRFVPGDPGSRGGKRQDPPITVKGITFTTDNETQFHVEVAISSKVLPYIHYAPGTTQMVMDIPNSVLSLPNPEDAEKTCTHRLVRGIHATQEQDSPPMTRIVLDTARVVGYRIDQTNDRISLDLLLPRNATGALSDKVIVVDAGHGGAATGADGRGGGAVVFEKDVTLAIALKLKDALEACGARVIMTRDRDVDVSLTARTDLANNVGADLFVSIHNDSNGSPNSASGTSTYYHMQDASSRALATCVQEAVMNVTGLPSRGVLSDSIMYHSGFAVLRQSQMPAVLCEVAYINNVRDRRKLIDDGFQQRVAQAICDGLRRYVEGTPTSPGLSNPKRPFNDPMPVNPPGSGEGGENGN
ncbi:MAG: N-acetylmuramoyl-L-alanine amidase [Chthonomonadaceae bacterium]|nr:N-acetylmuramoyl-L-alanine amidase [Chthonomonadaceae bacterium]